MTLDKACIFNIQKFSIHDGPGIRTVIFFKGCPLRCSWCSNPESQNSIPEKIWDENKKDYKITGEYKTSQEIMKEILKDTPFYEESEGGVTLSGGEVLNQAEFASNLLDACHKQGIHTACETSAYSSLETFKRFLSHVDFLIMDIKHYDEEKHFEKTGVKLSPILKNLKYAVDSNQAMLLRIPIIPNFNDSLEDAKNFGKLLSECNVKKIELLPFHQFGEKKYALLNREYEFKDFKQLRAADLEEYKNIIESDGITCII